MLPKPRVAPLLASLLLLATACSDGSSEGAPAPTDPPSATVSDPTSPAATEATEATDGQPAPSPSEDAAGEVAFPGIAPATGPLVAEETAELHAPQGWRASPEVSEFSSGARGGDASMLLIDTDLLQAEGLPEASIDEQGAKLLADLQARGGDYELQPTLSLAGVPAVWVKGTNSSGLQEIWISALVEGRSVELTMEAPAGALRRDPELFESVVNSWTWR